MSCRSACVQDGISYRMTYFIGGQVLLEGISNRRLCLIGEHVLLADILQEYMIYRNLICYRIICLQENTSYR